MKKVLLTVLIVLLVLALLAGLAAVWFYYSPYHAMILIQKDVMAEGVDGLMPYLTGDAEKLFNKVTSISENPLMVKLLNLVLHGDYLDILKAELQDVAWEVEDILLSSKHAQVMLSFDYLEEITGTINITMVRTDDGWKIDGFNSPKIDGMSLEDLDFSALEKLFAVKEAISEGEGFTIGGITIPGLEDFNFEDIEIPGLEEFNFEDIDFSGFSWKRNQEAA